MQKQNDPNEAVLSKSGTLRTILDEKEAALMVPGLEVPLTAEEADALGAFEETALGYEDVKAATPDVLEVTRESESK